MIGSRVLSDRQSPPRAEQSSCEHLGAGRSRPFFRAHAVQVAVPRRASRMRPRMIAILRSRLCYSDEGMCMSLVPSRSCLSNPLPGGDAVLATWLPELCGTGHPPNGATPRLIPLFTLCRRRAGVCRCQLMWLRVSTVAHLHPWPPICRRGSGLACQNLGIHHVFEAMTARCCILSHANFWCAACIALHMARMWSVRLPAAPAFWSGRQRVFASGLIPPVAPH